MKAAIGTLCIVSLLSVAPIAAYAAAPQAAAQADQSMRSAISSRISGDASLDKADIKVSVNAGVVTLTGDVATDAQRLRAAELAKAAGATRVENKIVVSANTGVKGTAGKIGDKAAKGADKAEDAAERAADKAGNAAEKTADKAERAADKTADKAERAADKTEDAASKAADKTEDAADKAWEKTKDGWEAVVDKTADITKKAGAEITDAWITTSIKTRMMGNDVLRGSNIDVDTDRHIVTLNGTVPSEAAREKAIDIVKDTDGVDKVVDKLTVRK